mgnify:CR=1 FL=1|jgi:hypothetical protein
MPEKTAIERIKELEERVKALEEKESAARPWKTSDMKDLTDLIRATEKINPISAPHCSVCGMNFEKTTGYVCYNMGCPTKISCFRS